MIMSRNIRERQILNIAFEQHGFRVIMLSEPTYHSFVILQQYMPDVILLDLPIVCTEQLSFTKRIRGYKRMRQIPIIGYGNSVSKPQMQGMLESGITCYIERPLKFNNLLKQIESVLKPFNKTLETKVEVTTDKEKDTALILEDNVQPSVKIETAGRHVTKLMAFPFTIATVLKITNDERSGAGHLAKAISSDPVIAAHLLKVSNSVFFASANRRISSIKEAIIRIGFVETKKIVMGMSVMNLFGQSTRSVGFDRTDFWYHSLTTALIAERIAKSFDDIGTEVAFLSGLLHDLGMLLLDEFFPPVFSEVLGLTAREAGHFVELAKARLKITHLDLIAELFPKWKIPQEITDAITGQYAITETGSPPATVEEKLSACIAIGNLVAKLMHSGRECDEFVTPLPNILLESAKMPAGITTGFIEDIKARIATFRSFLGLELRDYPCSCPVGVDPKKLRMAVWNPERALFIPPVIDFQNQGVLCEPVPVKEKASDLDGKYHAIICWTTAPVDADALKPFIGLQQAPFDAGLTGHSDSKNTPVIVFCPDAKNADLSFVGCSAMNNRFDLRLLEAQMGDFLFSGLAPADAVHSGKSE